MAYYIYESERSWHSSNSFDSDESVHSARSDQSTNDLFMQEVIMKQQSSMRQNIRKSVTNFVSSERSRRLDLRRASRRRQKAEGDDSMKFYKHVESRDQNGRSSSRGRLC